MKTPNTSLLLAAVGGVIALTSTLKADDACCPACCCTPPGLTASNPRAIEQFPELARAGFATQEQKQAARPSTVLAMNPRDLEVRGEVLRELRPAAPAPLLENRAVVASPRFLEQHPRVMRAAPRFEIAPMK